MAVTQRIQSTQLAGCDPPSLLKPFLPSHLGSFSGNQTIVKPAQYIGSFMVTGKGHHERAEVVRQKLETARAYTHCKPITLLISLNGIKVCRDSDQHVYMAHALRRISYATCDPDHLQFAFLAREPKAEPNVQYCHAFVTTNPDEAEELNNIVGEAFRIAYTQQQLALLAQRFRAVPLGQSPPVPSQQSKPISPIAADAPHSGHPMPHSESSSNPVSSNNLPPVSQPSQIDGTARDKSGPKESGDVHREHRSHKHHKHHKHRHRHKAKDVSAQTPAPIGDSSDSGLQTGESANGDAAGGQLPKRNRSQLPPAPPPRGSSALDIGGGRLLTTSPAQQLETSLQITAPSRQQCNTSLDVDTDFLHSISEEQSAGHMARPSSQISPTHAQNSYDIAEHQSPHMRVPTSATTVDLESKLSTSHQHPATTTSSSTTGCSTATSGSARSGSGSAGSFPGSKKVEARPDMRESSSLEKYPYRTRYPRRFSITQEVLVANGDRRVPDSSPSYDTLYESEDLAHVSWYQPHLPRQTALELLSRQPPGSFIIRDSGTHANCYAISVRFGEGSSRCVTPAAAAIQSSHSHSSSFSGESNSTSAYPLANTGICHFLIQRTPNGGVRLKGLDKEWPSLSCLVLHLTVMPEMLPCPLRLPKSAANPTFSPTDVHSDGQPSSKSSPSGCHNHPRGRGGSLEDEDYQHLSDFSAIMADLKSAPRISKRSNVLRSGR